MGFQKINADAIEKLKKYVYCILRIGHEVQDIIELCVAMHK